MQVITIATAATLPHARVLARSLERHQPGWPLEVLLIGHAGGGAGEGGVRLCPLSERLDLDAELLIARHEEDELIALLVPQLLKAYAAQTSAPVLHLPPTAWVLGELGPVEEAVQARSVALVPRVTADLPEDGLQPTQLDLESAGRISRTAMAVGGVEADGFLTWWSGELEKMLGSLDGGHGGARPEDREWLARYLELAPARFSATVLQEPGWNLSLWNLHSHRLEQDGDGALLVDGRWPARFIDLAGFRPDRPYRLAALASRARVSSSEALRELCTRYARELTEAGWEDVSHVRDVGRRLPGGLVYDEGMRALHARALTLGERFGDLFDPAGGEAFLAWLQGPAPHGSPHGINRYLFYRVARERPDVVRAYPELDGPDGAGYVAWCWAFGREELGIPDRFLPARDGAEPESGDREGGVGAAAPDARARANGARPAPGESSALAVRVTGYLGHTLGLGAAARGYVRALAAADVPVSTVSVPLHHLTRPASMSVEYGQHAFEDLLHGGSHGFEIVAVNADELPAFVERLGEGYFEGPRIGIWGWETNSIPARWNRAFELIDEIWVYSRFMAQNIGAVAPVPVVSLPPPVEAPQPAAEPARLGLPDGFLFLFVFDYLSTIQRKNPVGLIDAFKRAFAGGEDAQLLIKTINAPLRPLAEEELLWAAHGRTDIHIVDRSLESDELAGLMAACDCYVSLHRSEGFGLTLAEAMAIGKPVIATGYSGNVDFMNDANSYLVEYEIGRVGPECEIYPPDGEWAEPSLEHAAELMRRVYEDREGAARLGEKAAQDVAAALSPQARGAAMRRRLQELSEAAPAHALRAHGDAP